MPLNLPETVSGMFLCLEPIDLKISGILFFMISHIPVKFDENWSSFRVEPLPFLIFQYTTEL